MERLYLFFLAAGLGFLAAIPVGGSQVEACKRAICGHLRAAWMVVLGSVSSDIMYGIVALYGIGPILEVPWVTVAFSALGAVVLWVLAYLTIKMSRRPDRLSLDQSSLKNKRWAFLTGFSLAATNPVMILTWLWGASLAKHLGLATPFRGDLKAVFIIGGAVGLGGYLGSLSFLMYRLKHFIPLKALGRVYYWLGIVLFFLSFFFIYNVVRFFLKTS